jgi:hypothetical protein
VLIRAFVSFVFVSLILLGGECGGQNQVDMSLEGTMPRTILWAWERPEDLSFAEPGKTGVAFLAQTIHLQGDRVVPRPRRQPLAVSPGTYVIAVTRIETAKETTTRPNLSRDMAKETASLIIETLELPDVRAVQVDFDAAVSERDFYRSLMREIRSRLPGDTPLTMTALASWCTGDSWFNDFPVAEAVPMVFHMGADSDKVRNYLNNGSDWREPLCRGSYGLLVDDSVEYKLVPGRRTWYFKSTSWMASDLEQLR